MGKGIKVFDMEVGKKATGTIEKFDNAKGYGYIRADDGTSIFVHYSAIRGTGFRNLDMGERVEFYVESTPKGLQASDIVRLRFLQ
ncbi:MAG: hypothetical protein HFACDABA_00719 [Anaerolineales bacterium]|nr:hypothetical protein [Anaerolineales bacterium]